MKQRKRQIDPDFFHDEELASLEPHARLLFEGLWTLADREGALEDKPAVIHGFVFPFEPKVNVDKLLNDLQNIRSITRYEVSGHKYIYIRNLKKRQSIHPHESQSVIPIPENVIKCNDMQLQAIPGQYVDVDVEVKVKEGKKDKYADDIQKVYDFYIEQSGRNPNLYKLTDLRKNKIKLRLQDGFTVTQLSQAIQAVLTNSFNLGENKQNKQYIDIVDHIFGSYEQTEKRRNEYLAKFGTD